MGPVTITLAAATGWLLVATGARRTAPARRRARALHGRAGRPRSDLLVLPARWQALADDAGLGGVAPAAWPAALLAGPGVVVVATRAAPVLGALAAAGFLTAGRLARAALQARAEHRLVAAVPVFLEEMARSLRSGTSAARALHEAASTTPGPLGRDLRAIVVRVDAGEPMADAVRAWAERRPLPAVRLAASALALGHRAGGVQPRALDGVADTLRGDLAIANEVQAQSSQARASALLVTAVPLVFTAAVCTSDRAVAQFLLHTPAGAACLLGGLGLDAAGAVWMRRCARVEC